jgi:8-oxo-dGTP diphosphatase
LSKNQLPQSPSTSSNQKINPYVSVDCVIFGFDHGDLKVLLIERNPADKKDLMALPGNLVYDGENLDDAAVRVLKELTNLTNIFLKQSEAFGDKKRISKKKDLEWLKSMRDLPSAHVVTVSYYALVKLEKYKPTPAGFAKNAKWVSIKQVPELAFDHNEIINKAMEKLQYRLYFEPVGFELLPTMFTLAQVQQLYQTILQTELDKRNFRRKILHSGMLEPTDKKQEGVPHKPARLYTFNKDYKSKSSPLDKFLA